MPIPHPWAGAAPPKCKCRKALRLNFCFLKRSGFRDLSGSSRNIHGSVIEFDR